MSRASLSYGELLLSCTWWTGPDAVWGPDEDTEETDSGTMLHDALDGMVKRHAATLPTTNAQLLAMFNHGAEWLRRHGTVGLRSEIAFAWDWVRDAGRELETKGHRDYSGKTATEIPGTADLVSMGVDEDGAFVFVADWKFHFGGPRKSAERQLLGLGLAAARTFGVSRVKAVALHVDERGVDDTSERYEFDVFDLGDYASALRLRLTQGQGEPAPGEHCTARWCPALASCPATERALVQVIPDAALVRKDWRYQPVIESPDHLAYLLMVRPILRKAMKQVDAAADAYVSAGPVFTSDGREIYEATRSMPRLNMGALEALARAHGATDEEIAGCFRTSIESNGIRVSGARKGKAA